MWETDLVDGYNNMHFSDSYSMGGSTRTSSSLPALESRQRQIKKLKKKKKKTGKWKLSNNVQWRPIAVISSNNKFEWEKFDQEQQVWNYRVYHGV